MREYSYLSKSSNNKAKILSAALFFSAVVLLALSSAFELPYEGVFQMLCALFMTFSVLVLTRYVFKSFILSVFPCEGGFDFTVLIEGKTMKEVAYFVARKLAPIEYVTATATHFVLKTYKYNGVIYNSPKKDLRESDGI